MKDNKITCEICGNKFSEEEMTQRDKVKVEVLPPGDCRGSLDWWLEDLANFWYKLYCVGEGRDNKTKNHLRLLDKEDTEVF